MRRQSVLAAFLTAAAVAFSAFGGMGVHASEEVMPVDAPVKASVLMELSTGQVLSEQNAHEKRSISSLAKIMTVLLVSEALDTGALSMDEQVTGSDHAASMGGAQIWLKPGEKMTVEELLRAVVIGNANDAAVALAERVGTTEKAFVAAMNARAAQLGMSNTLFTNAAGIDGDGQYSTAYDLGLASRELMKHERLYPYMTTWMDDLRGGETSLVNNNRLVKTYKGIMGLMAATKTDASGFSMSACAIRDGFGLIAVVLGSSSNDERFSDAAGLLDTGFSGFELYSPTIDSALLTPVAVENGVASKVNVQAESMTTVVIPKGRAADVQQSVELADALEAPVESGQQIGTLTFTLDGKELMKSSLVALSPVKKLSVGTCFFILLQALFEM